MKRLFVLLSTGGALLLLMVLSAGAAHAQITNCFPLDTVVKQLADRHGETRQSTGLSANGHVFEVFANEETGTWTLTVTYPVGLTCLIATGQSFENLDEILPPEHESPRGLDL